MAKLVLKAGQVAQILSIVSRGSGDVSLSKAISSLNGDPKKDTIVIFTDSFGNSDVKPA